MNGKKQPAKHQKPVVNVEKPQMTNWVTTNGEDATCTEAKTCKLCGERTGEALGHTPGEWTETQPASCSQEGAKESTCTVCGARIPKVIPKLDHTLADSWRVKHQLPIQMPEPASKNVLFAVKLLTANPII